MLRSTAASGDGVTLRRSDQQGLSGFPRERVFGLPAKLVGPEPWRRGLRPLSPPAGGTSCSPYNPFASRDLGSCLAGV
jgi:hypothetical protein